MIHTKISYDLWANQQVCRHLKLIDDQKLLQETTRLLNHLLKAQVVWYNRVKGIDENIDIWGDFTLEECKSLLNDSSTMLEGIAAEIGGSITYKNSKGESFTDSIADIFEHVIIHGQHHRAQIFMLLSKAGIKPPSTDYIFYLRSL